MTVRIAHDHPTIETIDATVERHGGTTRPMVVVAESLAVEEGALVRLVFDGTEYRASVEASGNGRPVFRRAARSPSAARNPESAGNALIEWITRQDLDIGDPLHLDVVESGFRYGLRVPGEEAIYDSGKPDDSLAQIARTLESDANRSDS